VADQLKYMLSHGTTLAMYLPDFYNYLLAYRCEAHQRRKLVLLGQCEVRTEADVARLHVVTMQGSAPQEPECAIAEKQLYSSHYFETALDLTFCIRDSDAPKQTGFYLIKVMGSEQAGLTGMKGFDRTKGRGG
jgi:hypothetical protein